MQHPVYISDNAAEELRKLQSENLQFARRERPWFVNGAYSKASFLKVTLKRSN